MKTLYCYPVYWAKKYDCNFLCPENQDDFILALAKDLNDLRFDHAGQIVKVDEKLYDKVIAYIAEERNVRRVGMYVDGYVKDGIFVDE